MHAAVRGERNVRLENFQKDHPDVHIFFRDDAIALEGPPEEVERIRTQIQAVVDDYKSKNTTCIEVDIDPQHYKQLIGKGLARLLELQEQTGCDIKFPGEKEKSRMVKLIGPKESVEKAREILLERVKKLVSLSRFFHFGYLGFSRRMNVRRI